MARDESGGGRVVLVRHGRSALPPRRGRVNLAGVLRWRDEYDLAGLHADDRPPLALRALARDADHLVSSELPRAVASAALLDPERTATRSPWLREVPLVIPTLRLSVPVVVWEALIHAAWLLRGMDSTEDHRAQTRAAADEMERLASGGRTVVAVTHGAFRVYLAREVERRGWRRGSAGRRSYRPWSSWQLERPRP